MSELQVALEVQGLSKSIGRQAILRSVSFMIGRGETVGLVGPRGSGKSTLIKLLLGFLTPSAGRVWRFPLLGRSRQDGKPTVGYLPQGPCLPQMLTPTAFLGFCASFSGLSGDKRADRVSKVLAATGLEGVAGRSIRRLSPLEQRLVALAQAAMAEPDLLVVDALITGLTFEGGQAALAALDRLRADGQAVLLSSRSASGIAGYCQRILRLEAGQVAEVSPAEAKADEATVIGERLRVTLDSAPAALVELLASLGCHFEEDERVCTMTNVSPAAEQQALMHILQANRRILALKREQVPAEQPEVDL